jgi:hypothetical protein
MQANATATGQATPDINEQLNGGAIAPLRPLLAGARARGMADAFELLGVAAVFIDEGGFALHINDRARRRLGPQLWIDDGRLRAADLDLDDALSAAIDSALINGAPACAAADISFASEMRGSVALKVMPVAAEAHDPFQLLRAVVVIEEQGDSVSRAPRPLISGLN